MDNHFHRLLTNTNNNKIVTEIVRQLDECDEFIISVAFITYSGVVCILESLKGLEKANIKGKILTGCYLNFTEPKALQKLIEFSNIELKVLHNDNFHAKGFLFRKDKNWNIIIGSSNLTQSALTVNNEWNILLKNTESSDICTDVLREFYKLFVNAQHAIDIIDDYTKIYDSITKFLPINNKIYNQQISPNKIQQEALDNLRTLRENNATKALIISATGTGKTYLSAFDVNNVKPQRCLFIVHRTNIANTAMQSFGKIIKNKTLGLYTGDTKSNSDYLFATIQTLKSDTTLAKFNKNEFDYIIIDEVHHADANSYKKVLNHFEPKFLLGMTATPERSDNADIFKIFDHNVAYEIRLHQALDNDLLCPFHYFAVEDFYIESEKTLAKDFSKLVSDERVDHIVENMHFYGFSGKHRAALIFVSNIDEAIELADKLTAKGIPSQALTSQDSESARDKAISKLEQNELEAIITVDIFNEGIDIPCINQIILLRPTQSSIVYIQQLGRGLRKHQDKKFVVVLDFIANYDNNFLIPIALSQNNSYDKDQLKNFIITPNNYITGKSTISFSNIAKEIIYKNIQKTNLGQLKNIKKDYTQLRQKYNKIPTLLDFEKNNLISPEVILKTKDTYYDILKSFKENIPTLSSQEYLLLKFISKEFTPAKRLYEILILEMLLNKESLLKKELQEHLAKKIDDFNTDSFNNALMHLNHDIFKVNTSRDEYSPIITIENNNIKLSQYYSIINSDFLYSQILDLIEFNKLIYTHKYGLKINNGLSLYAKYSKKDIAHLLNQDYTNGGINLAGYRFFDDRCALFMTFDEGKIFKHYDNKFISKKEFLFYSKNNKTIGDMPEQLLAESKVLSYVFARVDAKDNYMYLGMTKRCSNYRQIHEPRKMIEYTFELETAISDNTWQYFKSIYKNKFKC